MPRPNLSPDLLALWLRDLAAHPVSPEQVELLTAWEPAQNRFYQNAEAALNLDPEGIPTWWPLRDPETLEHVSPDQRRAWCLEFLAGQFSPNQEVLRAVPDDRRRELLALHLVQTHCEISSSGWLPGPNSA